MVPLPFKKKAIDLTPKCCHIGQNKVKQLSGFDHFRTLSTGQPRRSNHSNRSNYSMRKKRREYIIERYIKLINIKEKQQVGIKVPKFSLKPFSGVYS